MMSSTKFHRYIKIITKILVLQLLHNKIKKLYHISINLAISLTVCICNHSFYESSLYLYKIIYMTNHSIQKLNEYITYINHSTQIYRTIVLKQNCEGKLLQIFEESIFQVLHSCSCRKNQFPQQSTKRRRMST